MKDRYTKKASALYDLDKVEDDIAFYLKYAQRAEGEILELGCGTGRISIPLVEKGIKVTAVDYSNNMIERLKEKSKGIKNSKNLTILRKDLTKINLNKKFDLIILPFRVFQCLLTVGDQVMALTAIKRHLSDRGLLIFDIYFPNIKILADIPSREIVDGQYKQGKKTIIKSHINRDIDTMNQVVSTEIIHYEKNGNTKKVLSINVIKMRYSFKWEIEHLLNLNGFKIKNLFSGYKSSKFIAGKNMIFICETMC